MSEKFHTCHGFSVLWEISHNTKHWHSKTSVYTCCTDLSITVNFVFSSESFSILTLLFLFRRIIVRLVSMAGTGYYYMMTRNRLKPKLEFMKHDPIGKQQFKNHMCSRQRKVKMQSNWYMYMIWKAKSKFKPLAHTYRCLRVQHRFGGMQDKRKNEGRM